MMFLIYSVGWDEERTPTFWNGPGMQVCWTRRPCEHDHVVPTDFSLPDAFLREDSTQDTEFYKKPCLVVHTDSHAIEVISGLYAKILSPGMVVLDLMSSWRSHLPESANLSFVVGLGLNQEEMADNPQLTEYVLHEFERMGLVLDYFLRSNSYTDLETFSSRGFPRPITDKYYSEMR